MINYERVAEKIFSIIKGHGHNLSMYKEDGMDTTDAAEARRFFIAKPNYMITLEEETNTIKINKNSDLSLEDLESIMKQMKNLARENMLNTQVKVFGKEITPKDFAYQAKKFKDAAMNESKLPQLLTISEVNRGMFRFGLSGKQMENILSTVGTNEDGDFGTESFIQSLKKNGFSSQDIQQILGRRTLESKNMNEISEASMSRMTGSKKTSYQTLESVKMVVRHRKTVDEDVRGSRSRQIKAIFLEQGGERFRFPHNHLAGARAMARHMYEGGNMRDNIGEYIIESVGNLIQLAEFVRYTRTNKLINETSEDVIKIVKENIMALSSEIKSLAGAKSYAKISEVIAARETTVLEENDTDLQDMFTVRKFDEKFGATLPLVSRLLSEKQAWRAGLLEASKQTIFMKAKEDLAEEDIMEFENPVQQVGYKISKVAKRMVESGDLSDFVAKVAGKLIEGKKISEFEHTIVRNVMENGKIEENDGECDECGCFDCLCAVNKSDTVESISDAYELKMKMIENEEIFEEEEYGAPCPECDGDEEHYASCSKGKIEESDKPKKTSCSKCNGTGREPGKSDSRYDRKMFSAVSCKACSGYGYGLSGDPARSLGKAKVTEESDYKDCPDCSGGYTLDGEKCTRCEGDGKIYEAEYDDLPPVGMTNADVRDAESHAGEMEAGAGMGYPDGKFKIENEAGKIIGEIGTDLNASPGNGPWYAINYDAGLDTVGFNSFEEAEAEVRLAEHLVDESLNELRKAAGIEIVEADAEKAGSGNVDPEDFTDPDDCPACEGTGNEYGSVTSLFGVGNDCESCDGTGYV